MALSPLATIQNILTADTELNANFTKISAAFDDIVDRQVATTMEADIDFNSNRALNLPYAVSNSEPVTLAQFHELLTDGDSTPVTLAGLYDYLTLSGQEITLEQVDLSTDVSGTLGTDAFDNDTNASDYTFLRGDGTWQKIPQQIIYPVRTTSATTATINTADQNAIIMCTNGAGCEVTITAGAFEIGQGVKLIQRGAGQITLQNGSGITINYPASGSLISKELNAEMDLICMDTDTFNLSGDLDTVTPAVTGTVNTTNSDPISVVDEGTFTVSVERTGGSDGAIDIRVNPPALCTPDYIDLSWDDGESGTQTTANFTATTEGGPTEIDLTDVGANSPTIGTKVDLTVTEALPSGTYTWETAYSGCHFTVDKPTLSSDAIAVRGAETASNSAELDEHLVSNMVLTIDGPVGDLTMTGLTNVELILTSNAVVGILSVDHNCQYIYIHGQNYRDGQTGYLRIGSDNPDGGMEGPAQDVTIDGITQRHTTGLGEWASKSNKFYCDRFSLLNSDLEAFAFVVLVFASESRVFNNAVFANNRMIDLNNNVSDPPYLQWPDSSAANTQASTRFVGARQIIFRHNYVENQVSYPGASTSLHAIRFHANGGPEPEDAYDTTDIWGADNYISTYNAALYFVRSGDSNPAGHIIDLWWERNKVWMHSPATGQTYDNGTHSGRWPINLRTIDNEHYVHTGIWTDHAPNVPVGSPPDEPHATNGYQYTHSGEVTGAYASNPMPTWTWDSWDV